MEVKKCSSCEQEYPATKDYFYTKLERKDGLEGVCKECNKNRKTRKSIKEDKENIGIRVCGVCKIEYPMTPEYFFRRKVNKNGFQTVCKTCKNNTPALIRRRKIGNDTLLKVLQERYRGLLHRSKLKKLKVDITVEDLINCWNIQNGICAISGIKMEHKIYSGKIDNNVSVDRIDSNLGYLKNNIQLVGSSINKMKSNLTMKDFVEICNNIVKFNKL